MYACMGAHHNRSHPRQRSCHLSRSKLTQTNLDYQHQRTRGSVHSIIKDKQNCPKKCSFSQVYAPSHLNIQYIHKQKIQKNVYFHSIWTYRGRRRRSFQKRAPGKNTRMCQGTKRPLLAKWGDRLGWHLTILRLRAISPRRRRTSLRERATRATRRQTGSPRARGLWWRGRKRTLLTRTPRLRRPLVSRRKRITWRRMWSLMRRKGGRWGISGKCHSRRKGPVCVSEMCVSEREWESEWERVRVCFAG